MIPARLGSTRFPRKVLYPLAGKPMVQWVWERAREARELDHVIIATDSPEVVRVACRFGAEAVLTRADHPTGTSRVAEAMRPFPHQVVVNIQGDEPLLDPGVVDATVRALRDAPWAHIATVALPLEEESRLLDPHVVKLVLGRDGRVLFFSRAPLPHGFAPRPRPGVTWEHQGIYTFRRPVLEAYPSLPPSPLEEAEGLEQLRFMEAGYSFVAVRGTARSRGVNTPQDAQEVEELLKEVRGGRG